MVGWSGNGGIKPIGAGVNGENYCPWWCVALNNQLLSPWAFLHDMVYPHAGWSAAGEVDTAVNGGMIAM